ncbi:MAG: hypothetical protein PHT58_02850 [Eubacteriales bacterium]|nr:hypothetical protein [Eubacteriales bacterium]
MKKFVSILLIMTLVLSIVACTAKDDNKGTDPVADATDAPANPVADTTDAPAKDPTAEPVVNAEPVEIEFWIGLSGAYGEAIQAQVDAYNASQSNVHVTVVYQGSYNDCAAATQQQSLLRTSRIWFSWRSLRSLPLQETAHF